MIGGTLMAMIGARLAFRYFGIWAGISAALYFVCYYGYLRNHEQRLILKDNNATEQIVSYAVDSQPIEKDMENVELNEVKSDIAS